MYIFLNKSKEALYALEKHRESSRESERGEREKEGALQGGRVREEGRNREIGREDRE